MEDSLIYVLGIDIGGTKCAVTLNEVMGNDIKILEKERFLTKIEVQENIDDLFEIIDKFLVKYSSVNVSCIGISCGGPLDSKSGVIICPPNLPNWINVPIVEIFQKKYNIPTFVQNDANACALAEWMWGAGQGTQNMIFLTFGTGMGAGLILDGSLYSGTNDLAGEVGHIRVAEDGPVGFGKAGSFEGFCSGGGIKRLGQELTAKWMANGENVKFCKNFMELEELTAEKISIAAQNGDEHAVEIFKIVGKRLGIGLGILIDILNPEKIVIGSIYARQTELIDKYMKDVLEEEVISFSRKVCEIVPAKLDEYIGDYATIAVAIYNLNKIKDRKKI